MPLAFPTDLHQQAAQQAQAFFAAQAAVDTVLVVNSCARGQAVPESDLDMAVLVQPETDAVEVARLEAIWRAEVETNTVLRQFRQGGAFAHLHVDIITGQYQPQIWDEGGGPDWFEVEIGNHVAYSAPMSEPGRYFRQLQAQWLPYYAETLRQQRLAMVRSACLYDLKHVAFFVQRGLYFQAFDRLYKAHQEFLQALFIYHSLYPLAYNKWIRMQVVDWLGLSEVYRVLPAVLSVSNIESEELVAKAALLEQLADQQLRSSARNPRAGSPGW